MVSPSCPALVIHEDDAFRKALVAALDRTHFTVSVEVDGDAALAVLKSRAFKVIVIGLDMKSGRGLAALEYLRINRHKLRAGLVVIGEPNSELRSFARVANETLLKPVDAEYVARRARTYCTD